MNTDFAVHTRGTCFSCVNSKCMCLQCQGQKAICGRGTDKFPMLGSCHWNTIIICEKRKKE